MKFSVATVERLRAHYQGLPVCVTGGAGFIGGHLADALISLGASITVLDDLSNSTLEHLGSLIELEPRRVRFVHGSVLDDDAVREAVRGEATCSPFESSAKLVFHLGAVGSVPRSIKEPQRTWSVNSTGTLRVLEAFTGGGAGQSGTREGRQFVLDQSVDFTLRKHSLRAGLLFEAGQWDSTQQANANGTYTFSSLADFQAGLARTYTRRVGDPAVSYTQYQAGWYAQDDFRLTRNLQVSLGLRQELQTHVNDKWNLAPRAAFTWTVAKTNVRGGWGVFYDWFESGTYEQTIRADGVTQFDEVVLNPTYPLTATSAGIRLPASRIQTAESLA